MAVMTMERIRHAVLALSGWRRRGLTVGLGVVAALALPPLHLVPLLIVAFVPLVWMIESRERPGAAFAVGWWFGFGFFSSGFYWISFSMLVEPEKYAWMIPFAVFGIGGFLALFSAVATLAARLAPSRGVGTVLALALAWTAMEWVRGWIFTGFPWNLLGTAWTFSDAMLQCAAVTGVWGLSLVTVAAAAMPAAVPHPRRGGWRPSLVMLGVLALVWTGGALRLAYAPDAMVPDVRLRLVQPNIPQAAKWHPGLRKEHILEQARMSLQEPLPTHVIWGETMVPAVLDRSPGALQLLGQATPPGGLTITGALRADVEGETVVRMWNSLFAVDDQGHVAGVYDKFHLVPFGEYVPLRSILPITKLTAGRGDFATGPGPRTLHLPGLPPVSPLICYEVIFPGHVTDPADPPQWLLNLTNDAWFGASPGPYQHFAASRFRAVEEGLPLVRVANTGISGVIDPFGRVVNKLQLLHKGVVDSPLPLALDHATPYAKFGDLGFLLAFLAVVAYEWLLWRRHADVAS